jgi:CheY-like chemotaxis protein
MRDVKPGLLVVDDALPIRMSLFSMLTALHYAVRVVPDGFTALAEIRKEIPDLILSELNMPGISGFELLLVVRRRFPSIQVIAMSSAFSGRRVPPGVAADAFYAKQAHPGLLLRIVEDITRPRRSPLTHRPRSSPTVRMPTYTISGEPYVTITCPECLRAFSQVLDSSSGSPLEADCAYCRQECGHTPECHFPPEESYDKAN